MKRRLSRVAPVPRRRIPRVESLEDRRLLAVLTVNTANPSSDGTSFLTLSDAIYLVDNPSLYWSLSPQQKNQVSGVPYGPANTIAFDIPGPGVHQLMLDGPLPPITAPVTINGYTQPGASPNTLAIGDNAVLEIELDGVGVGPSGNATTGLKPEAGSSTIEGLVINGFSADGIELADGGRDVIQGNFIGTDPTGETGIGNLNEGIAIRSGSNDQIGGADPADRNLISGNGSPQIDVENSVGPVSGAEILGNYIGTDATGTKPLDAILNQGDSGISVTNAVGVVIGGRTPGAGNLISVEYGFGIFIDDNNQPGDGGDLVQGNLIGTDATGTKELPSSGFAGIGVYNSQGNTVGGTTPGSRNVIAGYQVGVTPGGGANNLIEGDSVGVGADGVTPMGNQTGIEVGDVGDTIGGTTPGAANVIANSLHEGILLDQDAANTLILSNAISGNAGGGINDSSAKGGSAPILTAAVTGITSTLVIGELNNQHNSTFTIQFFASSSLDSASQAEGQRYLGSITAATDANGFAAIRATLPVVLVNGEWVTATASTPGRNTTPFSIGVQVQSQLSAGTTLTAVSAAPPSGRVYAFTLSALVASSQSTSFAPLGSVTFSDGSTVLAVVPLTPSGIASFTTPMLPPGEHHFTAVYSGDGVFEPSGSNVVTEVSQDLPPTVLFVQRGRRNGRPTVVVTFSRAMSPKTVSNIHNYAIKMIDMSKARRPFSRGLVRIVSASIGSFGTVVTLTLSRRLVGGSAYRLEIAAAPPTGVADANGTLLAGAGAGTSGTDAVVVPPQERKEHSHRGHRLLPIGGAPLAERSHTRHARDPGDSR